MFLMRRGLPALTVQRLCATALAGVLAAGLAGAASAETLADAITLAYQTNPTLQAQRAQLRATDENVVQARAGFRPTADLRATGTWYWQHYATCQILFGCFSGTSGGFNQNYNQLNATLSVNQPIYTGGRATARLKAAEAQVLEGREQLRQAEAQVMLIVIQAYEDVRRDEQTLAIRKDNVLVLQRQVDESRARFEVGEVTRTDVAQSEAQLAAAQALLSSAGAQLASSRAAYASAVGQSPGTLDPEPAFKIFPDSVDQAFDTVEFNNPQIRTAQYAEQAAEAQVSEARAQRMPQVGLQGSYGYEQPLNPFDSSANVRSTTASIVFTQPLFAGGATESQIRQFVEQANVARIQQEQARRTAIQNVSQAWSTLLAARANIVADEEQVTAAKVAFEGTRAEQQAGLRTTLEVLAAQQALENAQLALVDAHHDEYVAAAAVLNVMGLLEAKNLVPGIENLPGGHSFEQLKHAPGYVPGVDEAVSAIDSIGHKDIIRLPAKVDAPITTGRAEAVPQASTSPAR
jgi:outer membrane protein